jgi:H+/Cl- antiporter ClcA
MRQHPHVFSAVKREMYDWKMWLGRVLVLLHAAIAGLTIVAFTWLGEHALSAFHMLQVAAWWAPLVWTPFSAAAIVWLTQKFAPGAAGSGIPQVMAALGIMSKTQPENRS